MNITKQTPIKVLIENRPETAEILMAYGLQCINCHFSEFDTLEDGAKIHGLSEEDIKMIIKDVKKVVNNTKNNF